MVICHASVHISTLCYTTYIDLRLSWLCYTTVKFLFKTGKPTTAVLTPSSLALPWNPVTRTVQVVENQESEFTCEIFGSDSQPDVTFTLGQLVGTTSVTDFPATSTLLDCVRSPFTQSVSLTLEHGKHHGQRLECSASNSAGDTSSPGIVYLDVQGRII